MMREPLGGSQSRLRGNAMQFMQKKTIFGCDVRGDGDSPYLTRFTLIGTKLFQVAVHVFHRSDADDLHDHPWNFVSFIVWRGYNEQTPRGKQRVYPGMVLVRPATWVHRVELVGNRKAVTLVVMGKRRREWGMWARDGWMHWKEYFAKLGC